MPPGNFMPDNYVRCEATFVGDNPIFIGHCPMSSANIQSCFYKSKKQDIPLPTLPVWQSKLQVILMNKLQ